MKKNIFTDIAGHPYVYLFVVIFLYLVASAASGLTVLGRPAKGIEFLLLIPYLYSVAFVYGTYVDINYNLRYSSKGGIFIFLFACVVVFFPLLIVVDVLVGRFLSGDFS
jgi:hypothetical protein